MDEHAEDRLMHYLQIPGQIAGVQVEIAKLGTKMDAVLAQDKKTERRLDDHDSRLVALEQRGVAADSKWGLGKYVFEIIWTLILALIGAGVWLK